jgi:hypothetical protein
LGEGRKRQKVHSEIRAQSSWEDDIVDRLKDLQMEKAQKLNKKRNCEKFERFDFNF